MTPGFRTVLLMTLLAAAPALRAQPLAPTLQVQGRQILDRCGNPLIVKGLEQVLRVDSMMSNSWLPIMDQIARTGANAVRLVNDDASVSDLNAIIGRAVSHGLVVYLTAGPISLGDPALRQVLANYRGWLVLDVGEPSYTDAVRWRNESISAVQFIRSQGYEEPICLMLDTYGRNLPTALSQGPAVVNADPLHRVIIGWQAYWGQSNWYQNLYGMTYTQAMAQVVQQSFPIQVGITYDADNPPDPMNYSQVMTLAHQNSVSTMWWDYYNRAPWLPPPEGDPNDLSVDGMTTNLTPLGVQVLRTHQYSFQNAPMPKACTGAAALPTVSVSTIDSQASEAGPDSGTFRIARTAATTSALTVAITMTQNAVFNTDYRLYVGTTQLTSLQVAIPSGSASVDIRVTPIQESLAERTEWARLTLSANAAYTLGSPSAATVAIDDDYFAAGTCRANYDESPNGSLTANDFTAFLNAYATGIPRADSNADGNLNAVDFIAFINFFAVGC